MYIEVEMWWLVDSAPDILGRGPGFESGISHKDPEVLQGHCVNVYTVTSKGWLSGDLPWGKKCKKLGPFPDAHRRRINTEEKAKFVAAAWGLGVRIAILHQDDLKKRTNRLMAT